MSREPEAAFEESLEALVQRLSQWRATRASVRSSIPKDLWQEAVRLAGASSVWRVSKALRLNATDLKRRCEGAKRGRKGVKRAQAGAAPSGFVEVEARAGAPAAGGEVVVEVQRRDGAKLSLRGADGPAMAGLMHAFLGG